MTLQNALLKAPEEGPQEKKHHPAAKDVLNL